MLETTARSAHCQRCTICSRQNFTEDFFHDSTQNKRKIRQDSEAHTRQLKALKSCGIEHDYISLLKKIYRDQEASVLTDEESDMFETTFHAGKRKKEWEST